MYIKIYLKLTKDISTGAAFILPNVHTCIREFDNYQLLWLFIGKFFFNSQHERNKITVSFQDKNSSLKLNSVSFDILTFKCFNAIKKVTSFATILTEKQLEELGREFKGIIKTLEPRHKKRVKSSRGVYQFIQYFTLETIASRRIYTK